MKKLLVLILVFVMSSAANATLQISVDGDQDPADTEIAIILSEVIILDIWTTTVISGTAGGEGFYALAAKIAYSTISGGYAQTPYDGDPGIAIYDDAVGVLGVPLPPGENGVGGTIIMALLPQINAGDTIFNGIDFHCEWGLNDVLVSLWYSADGTTWNPVDTVVIHQGIPEPATFLLFALGGLALLRKRRT